jgi:OOP family OmpA-OmpF porin
MKKLIVALIASAAAISAAQAQTTQPRGYVGAGVAIADHDYSIGGVTEKDDYKAAGKIYGGYELNQTWAVEAGYTDLRASDFSYNGGTGTSKGYGYYVAGKATMPINEQFSAYGKLGVENSVRKLNTTTGLNMKDSETGAYAALGLQYKVSQDVALTAEYERYGKSKDFGAKADVWTLGAKYSF